MAKITIKSDKPAQHASKIRWVGSIFIIFLGLILVSANVGFSFALIFIGLYMNPKVNRIISSVVKSKKLRALIAVSFIAVLLLFFGQLGNEIEEYEENIIAEGNSNLKLPVDVSPCDFLPAESAVPTEFLISESKEANDTCSQTYYEQIEYGSSSTVIIHMCGDSESCTDLYNKFVNLEKSRRGYSLMNTIEGCFGTSRERTLSNVIKLYCNYQVIVYEQTYTGLAAFDFDPILRNVPQGVADRVTEKVK